MGKNAYIRNVLLLSGGAALGQAALLAASPIVSRLYDPEQFGVFGVYLSIVGFVSAFASLRLELAIPLQKERVSTNTLTLMCMGISAVVATLFAIGLAAIQAVLDFQWQLVRAIPVVFMAIGIFLLGAFNVLTYRAISDGGYPEISVGKALYGFTAAIVQVSGATLGWVGLVASDFIARGCGGLYIYRRLRQMQPGSFPIFNVSRLNIIELWVRNKKFPLIAAPSAAVNAAGVYTPTLLVAMFYGPGAAGAYIFATRVVGGPTGLISQAVSKVYIGEVVDTLKQGGRGVSKVLGRTVAGLFGAGALPFAIIAMFGPVLFAWVFGENWRYAGEIVSRLTPMLFFQFIAVPVSQTLNLIQKQWVQGAWDVLRFVTILVNFAAFRFLDMELLPAVTVLSLSISVCYVLLLVLSLIFAAREVGRA